MPFNITSRRLFRGAWTWLSSFYCNFLLAFGLDVTLQHCHQLLLGQPLFEHTWLGCFDDWVFNACSLLRFDCLDFHHFVGIEVHRSLASGVSNWIKMACFCSSAYLHRHLLTASSVPLPSSSGTRLGLTPCWFIIIHLLKNKPRIKMPIIITTPITADCNWQGPNSAPRSFL